MEVAPNTPPCSDGKFACIATICPASKEDDENISKKKPK